MPSCAYSFPEAFTAACAPACATARVTLRATMPGICSFRSRAASERTLTANAAAFAPEEPATDTLFSPNGTVGYFGICTEKPVYRGMGTSRDSRIGTKPWS